MAFYENHPMFDLPDNEDASIWRYMSFSKFVSLFTKSALYFSVANRFDDKWEGTIPLKNKEIMDGRVISFYESARSLNALCCWHLRENESAAMWKSYTQNNEGIAIRSTVRRLKSCFVDQEGPITYKCPVFIGKVKYIDYDSQTFDLSNGFLPLLHKRTYFAEECEIRAVIGGTFLESLFLQGFPGINVPIKLETLIEQVYVDPVASDWFFELVKGTVGENFEVCRSSIGEKPPRTSSGMPVRSFCMIKKAGKDWEYL